MEYSGISMPMNHNSEYNRSRLLMSVKLYKLYLPPETRTLQGHRYMAKNSPYRVFGSVAPTTIGGLVLRHLDRSVTPGWIQMRRRSAIIETRDIEVVPELISMVICAPRWSHKVGTIRCFPDPFVIFTGLCPSSAAFSWISGVNWTSGVSERSSAVGGSTVA